MQMSTNLVRASRVMAWLSIIGAILVPILVTLCFLFPVHTQALDFHIGHLGAPLTGAVPLVYRIGALIFELVPTAAAMWGLISLALLFQRFSRGEVFSPLALGSLRAVTVALLANVVTAFVVQAPISFLLTHANPAGHRIISLGLGSDDVEVLFLAGITFVIARVMAEARRIADEHAKFV